MTPAIGPIGLDYIAGSAKIAGIEVEIVDLGLADEPVSALTEHFSASQPELVGISFRNNDDCFWPSADWFVPELKSTVETIRDLTQAPIVIGGVGFSILSEPIFEYTGVDFGVRGDGEPATTSLIQQLRTTRDFADVPGLIWRDNGKTRCNPPSWPDSISLNPARDSIDNLSYFERGGQCGLETKRGCNRNCIYCADPLAKGTRPRLRNPAEVADEVESLLSQGIDVLHFCDSEFNVPRTHAYAVCQEFSRRSLGKKIRWYAYLSPSPFDVELAKAMAQAGCVGINFTGDSGCEAMLRTYRQQHNSNDIATAVELCRLNGVAVMIDLLLGGPGETPQTVTETIDFIKQINPDCAGAALGIRVYPNTPMERIIAQELQEGKDANIRRKYSGPIDLLKPTFYISGDLGEHPAALVKELIGGDKRFFEPMEEVEGRGASSSDSADYNYNENLLLAQAIRNGTRGAYWDILRQLRNRPDNRS